MTVRISGRSATGSGTTRSSPASIRGEIEHVVEKLQQGIGELADAQHQPALGRIEARPVELRHQAGDPVQQGADLVAHGGEESRAGGTRRLRLLAGALGAVPFAPGPQQVRAGADGEGGGQDHQQRDGQRQPEIVAGEQHHGDRRIRHRQRQRRRDSHAHRQTDGSAGQRQAQAEGEGEGRRQVERPQAGAGGEVGEGGGGHFRAAHLDAVVARIDGAEVVGLHRLGQLG